MRARRRRRDARCLPARRAARHARRSRRPRRDPIRRARARATSIHHERQGAEARRPGGGPLRRRPIPGVDLERPRRGRRVRPTRHRGRSRRVRRRAPPTAPDPRAAQAAVLRGPRRRGDDPTRCARDTQGITRKAIRPGGTRRTHRRLRVAMRTHRRHRRAGHEAQVTVRRTHGVPGRP